MGAVVGRVLAETPDLRTDPGPVAREVALAVKRVNALSIQEQQRTLAEKYPEAEARKEREGRGGLPPLPNAG